MPEGLSFVVRHSVVDGVEVEDHPAFLQSVWTCPQNAWREARNRNPKSSPPDVLQHELEAPVSVFSVFSVNVVFSNRQNHLV